MTSVPACVLTEEGKCPSSLRLSSCECVKTLRSEPLHGQGTVQEQALSPLLSFLVKFSNLFDTPPGFNMDKHYSRKHYSRTEQDEIRVKLKVC